MSHLRYRLQDDNEGVDATHPQQCLPAGQAGEVWHVRAPSGEGGEAGGQVWGGPGRGAGEGGMVNTVQVLALNGATLSSSV